MSRPDLKVLTPQFFKWWFSGRNRSILHFLFLSSLLLILSEWQHENNLYRNIGRAVRLNATDQSDTAIIREAMLSINAMMQARSKVFQDHETHSLKQSLFNSADIDLMYGSGACGGYSMVLARTLQLMGYNVRIGQLKTITNGYGGHIIIEYWSDLLGKWVMVDPLFLYIPIDQKNVMAAASEVAAEWSTYSPSMPEELRNWFQFTDVRYTNWSKWGWFSNSIRSILEISIGKKNTSEICMRMFFLSSYPLIFSIWLISFGFFYGVSVANHHSGKLE